MTAGPWRLRYEGYDPTEEPLREALCSLGNGYLGSRGAAPECAAGGAHYPGTYLAGVFNRLAETFHGTTVSNESIVNLPNWLVLRFRTPGQDWYSPDEMPPEEYYLELDLRRGILARGLTWVDAEGRRTGVTQRRIVHMRHPHLLALETTFVAENWSGELVVRSALDGRVGNTLVTRYRDLAHHHHDPVRQEEVDSETVLLQVETTQSLVRVAQAARTRVHRNGDRPQVARTLVGDHGWIGHDLTVPVEEGRPVTVEKVVAVHAGGDRAISESAEASVRAVQRAGRFDDLVDSHASRWSALWERFGTELVGTTDSVRQALNLHTFHTLQTVSPNSMDLDVGVPARGLCGEAYRGHIFWDEIFVLPFLDLRLPALSRSLLMYRYRRLDEARHRAAAAGHRGANYPWQSGSDGREETQQLHLNPRSGRWLPDHSSLQRHVNHAVAFNVVHYTQTTGDMDFLRYRGGPMLIEIARFLVSITSYDRSLDRYRIRGVVGPDEFHDRYPGAAEPGLDDNAYTNVMTVWLLKQIRELLEQLPAHHRADLWEELGLSAGELDQWEAVTRKMFVPFHDGGILSQFDGYERLEELDWDGYRRRYDSIQRLDRILEAEGDDVNRYKAAKQADTLMLFYLLSAEDLVEVFARLGYDWDTSQIPRTIEYYAARTSHGSTLSGIVHSWLLARLHREDSWRIFTHALDSDIADTQGGTTAEGIHLGVMAGSLDLLQRGYAGIAIRHDVIWLEPALPAEVDRLAFPLHFRGHRLSVDIEKQTLTVSAPPSHLPAVRVGHHGTVHTLTAGGSVTIELEGHPEVRADADDGDADPWG
ncbi:glycoside hydrolase family 65 protein [Actinotalea sp.]|uniref:glycoside hydrolase family 65 protein n=1 Tax=Actinotalea sp. TaxID=1872145 RepID=UPI00356276ED